MKYPKRIQDKIVDSGKTIIQTMQLMDEGFTKSLIVFDKERFLGIITNGDLQRAIIAKVPFDTPIVKVVDNKTKRYATVSDDREKIKSWMLEKRAEFMPILDKEGNLADVIFWNELFADDTIEDNRPKIDLPVVIMAGGKGTRLKPITNVLPKPLWLTLSHLDKTKD